MKGSFVEKFILAQLLEKNPTLYRNPNLVAVFVVHIAEVILFVCLFLARQPPVGHGLLIHKVSRSHSDTPQSVGLLWTSDQLVAESYFIYQLF